MIAKRHIEASLKGLQAKFKASNPKDSLYYSKLAILELCGWIEESMDETVLSCARKRLKGADNLKSFENDVVRRTFAFDYDKFRMMLIRLIGLINVERLEAKMDPAIRVKFEATLATLKVARNTEAHTHIKGVTRSINAPSVTISHLQDVYVGLRHIERLLRAAKI